MFCWKVTVSKCIQTIVKNILRNASWPAAEQHAGPLAHSFEEVSARWLRSRLVRYFRWQMKSADYWKSLMKHKSWWLARFVLTQPWKRRISRARCFTSKYVTEITNKLSLQRDSVLARVCVCVLETVCVCVCQTVHVGTRARDRK